MIEKIISQVREGVLNPLDAYIQLKSIESQAKEALILLADEALVESKKYGEKSFTYKNAKVTVKSNAGTWDFKHINGWVSVAEKKKEFEEAAKMAYKTKGKSIQFDMNGEEIEAAKYMAGRDGISVQILNKIDLSNPLDEIFQ